MTRVSPTPVAYWMPQGYSGRDKGRALHILGDAVIIRRHEYDRDPASGSGNCWCGRPRISVLHPHEFTPAAVDPMRCVCRKPPNHRIHRPKSES